MASEVVNNGSEHSQGHHPLGKGISAEGAAAGQGGPKRHIVGLSTLEVAGGGSLLGGGDGGQQVRGEAEHGTVGVLVFSARHE